MTPSPQALAVMASKRFGLGARPGDLDRLSSDPRAAVMAELDGEVPNPTGLLPLADLFMHKFRWEQHLASTTQRKPKPSLKVAQAGMADASMSAEEPLPPGVIRMPEGQFYDAEVEARLALLRTPAIGMPERLVWFWSNHFAVAGGKGGWQRATVGCFEREVIRPHAFGRFADMLRASTRHFAMLNYLDNANSVGPNSALGRARGGLNENLAREVMELHTLGVGGGYAQADVQSFAAILTGWTSGDPRKGVEAGRFTFDPLAHEPGRKVLMGRTFAEAGEAEGVAALDALARHPATAHFIAFKLARHFVADVPPAPLVDRLASTFRATDGDLRAVSRALVSADEAWENPAAKLRSPQEFVAAALRAMQVVPSARTLTNFLKGMGQVLWFVPGPNGYPDIAAPWLSAATFKARFEVASGVAERERLPLSPEELATSVLGETLAPQTMAAIRGAANRHEAMAIVLLSSEFQRR